MIKDLVICNNCGVSAFVDFDQDDCLECGETGMLMDIVQDWEV